MTRTLHERPQIWFAVTYDCCLSLRAPQDVVNSFDVLCVVIRNQYDGDADEVLDYFENTYIGRFLRNAPPTSSLVSYRVMEQVPSNR